MNVQVRPSVLCVDDEERVVAGLAAHLRRDYDLHVALSGEQALEELGRMNGAAVVVSDMRMPGMDGAMLLGEVRQRYPDATRILLTGEAGRDGAMRAVNEGQIFRFLTKPCPPDQLRSAIDAGVVQHRLAIAERQVLQETLIGCIKTLIDVLAMTNPAAFGRASRVKRLTMEFAGYLGCKDFWQLEAAAMLSQIGYLSLPVELVDKLYYGERLTSEERVLAGGVPKVATRLLGHVPRLEPVMQILTALDWNDAQFAQLGEDTTGLGARILGLVLEYDTLMAQGTPVDAAVQALHKRSGRFGTGLIEKLAEHMGAHAAEHVVREIQLRHLLPGMTILQDVRTSMGTLLVAKGFEVTHTLLERIPHFGPDLLAEQVRVLVPVVKPKNPGSLQ